MTFEQYLFVSLIWTVRRILADEREQKYLYYTLFVEGSHNHIAVIGQLEC